MATEAIYVCEEYRLLRKQNTKKFIEVYPLLPRNDVGVWLPAVARVSRVTRGQHFSRRYLRYSQKYFSEILREIVLHVLSQNLRYPPYTCTLFCAAGRRLIPNQQISRRAKDIYFFPSCYARYLNDKTIK